MVHTLKVVCLSLVVVFALGSAGAAVASAQGKLTSDGPVTLKSTETGPEKSNAWTMFGLRTECPGSVMTGHKFNVTPHVLIPSGESTVTITPHYVNCKFIVGGLSFPATIDMNGCDYVVHLGAAGAVTFDIVCPAGKEITETLWTNSSDHANAATPMCVLHFKEQKGIAGVTASNGAGGVVNIAGTLKNIHALKTKTTHGLLCPEATTSTAEIDMDITVRGFNAAGEQTGISLS